jgi:hypothetical protein
MARISSFAASAGDVTGSGELFGGNGRIAVLAAGRNGL